MSVNVTVSMSVSMSVSVSASVSVSNLIWCTPTNYMNNLSVYMLYAYINTSGFHLDI